MKPKKPPKKLTRADFGKPTYYRGIKILPPQGEPSAVALAFRDWLIEEHNKKLELDE